MERGWPLFPHIWFSTQLAPLGSLLQHPGRGLRGLEGLLHAEEGQQNAVHDGQPDPRVVAAHGARGPVRVGRCTHDCGGETARHCGAVCVVRPGHAGDCEGRGGHGAVRLRGGGRCGAAGARDGLRVLQVSAACR
ncbi:putative elongation factor 1-gamma (EF-1-gamma) [Trypanosoma cruzi]|nr:putative elongation factor 1-gamma (EF-1-gamma) [Trypanosoma cruzi]